MESRGDRIAHVRTTILKLTQQEMADELGVKRAAVTNWEANKGVSRDHLLKISELSGVSMDWIEVGSGQRPPPPDAQITESSKEIVDSLSVAAKDPWGRQKKRARGDQSELVNKLNLITGRMPQPSLERATSGYRPPPTIMGEDDFPVYRAANGISLVVAAAQHRGYGRPEIFAAAGSFAGRQRLQIADQIPHFTDSRIDFREPPEKRGYRPEPADRGDQEPRRQGCVKPIDLRQLRLLPAIFRNFSSRGILKNLSR